MIRWFYWTAALYCASFLYFGAKNGVALTFSRSVHSATAFILACIFAVLSASPLPDTDIFVNISAVVGVAAVVLHVTNNVFHGGRFTSYDRV